MANDDLTKNFKKDSVTGYLEPLSGEGILPRHKTAFLKNFKKTGDKTKAIESQGFRFSDIAWHIENDPQFKADLRDTFLSMKHELEGMMFESAFKASGHRERQLWLETNFPEEYGKRAAPKGQKEKSKIDTLLENL
jgi:hypothetical protein